MTANAVQIESASRLDLHAYVQTTAIAPAPTVAARRNLYAIRRGGTQSECQDWLNQIHRTDPRRINRIRQHSAFAETLPFTWR